MSSGDSDGITFEDESYEERAVVAFLSGKISIQDLQVSLELSRAQTYRVVAKYRKHGADGLKSGKLGKANNAYPKAFRECHSPAVDKDPPGLVPSDPPREVVMRQFFETEIAEAVAPISPPASQGAERWHQVTIAVQEVPRRQQQGLVRSLVATDPKRDLGSGLTKFTFRCEDQRERGIDSFAVVPKLAAVLVIRNKYG